MRHAIVVVAISMLATTSAHHPSRHAVERAAINDNRTPAGALRDGVLRVELDVREVDWRPDGDGAPGIVLLASGQSVAWIFIAAVCAGLLLAGRFGRS